MKSRAHTVFVISMAITYLVIADKYIHFVTRKEIFGGFIEILEWLLLVLLSLHFFQREKPNWLKLLLMLFVVKIAIYALYFGQYNFQKNILILCLLMFYTFQEQDFRDVCMRALPRQSMIVLGLLVFSFLPFLPFYNRYFEEVDATTFADVQRFGGLWELPHVYAYFILAILFIGHKRGILFKLFLWGNVLLTGVRSALIAGSFFLLYDISRSFVAKKRIDWRPIGGIALLLLFLLIGGFGEYLQEQYEFHIQPLFEEDITDPYYGKGRFIFNFIAIQDIASFTSVEWLIGRSASSLYEAFERYLGIKSWPHNDYVTVLYIYGLIGLALYLYTVFYLPIKRGGFRLASNLSLAAMLIFILALTNGYYTYHSLYLFCMGIGVAYEEDLQHTPGEEGERG